MSEHEPISLLASSIAALVRQGDFSDLTLTICGRCVTVRIVEVSTTLPATSARLSAVEKRIMSAISADTWTNGEEIASRTNERYGEGFRTLLANLVERGAIESAPGRGYRARPD